jgi:hypothetical protein
VSLFLWADNGDRRLWFSIAAALALLICTKETFVINVAAIAVGIAAAVNPIALIRKLRAEWEYVCGGLLLLFFLVITCFSGGLRWFDGVRELFLAVPQWIGRGTSSDPGHFKPFFFYLTQMIVPTEPYLREGVLLSVALILAALFLKRWRDIFSTPYRLHRFLLVWALTIWVAYSAVPYKTPWLVINITLPLILVATLAVITLGRCGGIWKKLHYLLIALLLAVGVNNSIYFNFKEIEIFGYRFAITGTKPYGSGNPFSYVHTSPGMLELLADIEYYRRAHPKARVLVGAEQYWPLPFYFRNYPNGVGV